MEPLLEVKNLKTSFKIGKKWVPAVEQVCFHVDPGETLGIVGESGCGKSVTSMSIMRLLPKATTKIEADEIILNGKNIANYSDKEMAQVRGTGIGMIFQDSMTSLNPVKTIGKQLDEAFIVHHSCDKNEAKNRSIEMLTKVGIPSPEKRYGEYPHQLSGGMRQRVMIAMALAQNPSLIIADEPTTALDVTIQAQIMELMKEMKEKKMEKSIKKLCYLALFCAIAIVLSYVESLIPLYLGAPGAKLGLANVVTLTLLLCFGLKEAFIVMFLRILIVSMTFTNFYMFLYSLSGGLLSLIIMYF